MRTVLIELTLLLAWFGTIAGPRGDAAPPPVENVLRNRSAHVVPDHPVDNDDQNGATEAKGRTPEGRTRSVLRRASYVEPLPMLADESEIVDEYEMADGYEVGPAAREPEVEPHFPSGWEEECPPTPLELLWWQRFRRAWVGYAEPNDPQRHFGFGQPLVGTSWRNRPWYASGFAGGVLGDELQAGQIDQGGGFIAGGRLGFDFSHYSGAEVRLAASDLDLNYSGATFSGQSRNTYFDLNFLYYPLGDTRWRPYLSVGLGVASFHFDSAANERTRGTAVSFPFGGGLKLLLGRNWAARFELVDNFTLASGSELDAMHNVTFTGGLEFHFGGKYVHYGPW